LKKIGVEEQKTNFTLFRHWILPARISPALIISADKKGLQGAEEIYFIIIVLWRQAVRVT
jgi:hypothetical protein